MAEAIGSRRKLHRHEGFIPEVIESELLLVVPTFRLEGVEHTSRDEAGEEVVDDDPLVMPAHDPL